MAKVRKDFIVDEYINKQGELRWRVISGGTVVTICRALKEAQELVTNLNIDPWFLDRGFTRADRAAAYNKGH
tara:strand:+ start:65 stop:280 length:216 start_codon:yes stop_codon:yes gene_type:complete